MLHARAQFGNDGPDGLSNAVCYLFCYTSCTFCSMLHESLVDDIARALHCFLSFASCCHRKPPRALAIVVAMRLRQEPSTGPTAVHK